MERGSGRLSRVAAEVYEDGESGRVGSGPNSAVRGLMALGAHRDVELQRNLSLEDVTPVHSSKALAVRGTNYWVSRNGTGGLPPINQQGDGPLLMASRSDQAT